MEKTFKNNNLENLRGVLRLTNRDFAEKIGVHETQYTKMKKGTYPLGDKTINKIKSSLPEYNIDWLLYGVGDKYTKDEQKRIDHTLDKVMEIWDKDKTPPTAANFHSNKTKDIGELQYPMEQGDSPFIDLGDGKYVMVVPLVNEYAYGGYLSSFKDTEYLEELPKHTIIVDKHHRGQYRAFEVVGDSMDDNTKDSIADGSIATGREIQRHLWNSKFHTHRYKDYIIVSKTEGIVIKRISKQDPERGIITCHSLNPDKENYPDFDIDLDDIEQIFNVVAVTQKR